MTDKGEDADGDPAEDGVAEDLEEIDQRLLVHAMLFKGLVSLLVEKRVITRDEFTTHLLDMPDFRMLHDWRRDAMPSFESALKFLWQD